MKSRLLFIFWVVMFWQSNIFGYTILIDPGHGGDDDGARGEFILDKKKKKSGNPDILEKDLALIISTKLGNILRKKHNVFLTRTVDRTLALENRAEMANKIRADLFISVHINSSTKMSSNGHEIYYLDNHDDVGAKRVEKLENISLKGEQLIIQKILIDLVVERTASISKRLSEDIQTSLNGVMKRYKIKNRGVKPGLFYVLALSKRPAILLEVGFLSNNTELKKMISEKFQDSYVKAVAKGINRFIKRSNKGKSDISVL